MCIEYEWDEEKRLINLTKHGVDSTEAYNFDWESALIIPDYRFDYNGEERYIATGLIEYKVYRFSFTHRGDSIRIINMRKAIKHEVKEYVKQI